MTTFYFLSGEIDDNLSMQAPITPLGKTLLMLQSWSWLPWPTSRWPSRGWRATENPSASSWRDPAIWRPDICNTEDPELESEEGHAELNQEAWGLRGTSGRRYPYSSEFIFSRSKQKYTKRFHDYITTPHVRGGCIINNHYHRYSIN